jgi:hypothetical protein
MAVQGVQTTVQDARIANNGLFEIGNLLHLVAL